MNTSLPSSSRCNEISQPLQMEYSPLPVELERLSYQNNVDTMKRINNVLHQLRIASDNHRRLIEEKLNEERRLVNEVKQRNRAATESFNMYKMGHSTGANVSRGKRNTKIITQLPVLGKHREHESRLKLMLVNMKFGEISCESVSQNSEHNVNKLMSDVYENKCHGWSRKLRECDYDSIFV